MKTEDNMKNGTKRLTALFFTAAVLLTALSGCSSNGSRKSDTADVEAMTSEVYYNGKYDYGYDDGIYKAAEEESYYEYEKTSSDSPQQAADTRKIIRTMQLTAETLDFDASVKQIQAAVSGLGGYVESSNVSGNNLLTKGGHRYASFTLRIPAAKLDEFVSTLGDGINIVSKYENSQDITDTYYDAAARLKSLETQEERLLSMLEGATELQYMLELEDHLANVRYQIESYYSTLQRYDSQVSMATLNISLEEVIEYKPTVTAPKTFGERISTAFRNSWADFADGWQDFSVDFVYAIPTLLIWAVIIFVIVLIVRGIIKKNRAKKARKEAAIAAYQASLSANSNNADNSGTKK